MKILEESAGRLFSQRATLHISCPEVFNEGVVAALGTFIFTIVIPGTVTVLVPHKILASNFKLVAVEIGAFRSLGWLPMTCGLMMYLWCAWDFTFSGRGTPAPIAPLKKLVVQGLYKYVRNPMYVGVALILLGEAVLFESVELFLYAVVVLAAFHTFVVFYEEPTLRRQFTDLYAKYCRSVPRWIPKVRL